MTPEHDTRRSVSSVSPVHPVRIRTPGRPHGPPRPCSAGRWVPILTRAAGSARRWSHGPHHCANARGHHPGDPQPGGRPVAGRGDLRRRAGHWLIAAVVVRDGELVPGTCSSLASWTHPLTWVFQVMPVFFLVGGYANALSWRSARARDVPYAGWLRSRLRRLLVPVVPLLLAWLVATSVAFAAGVPSGTLRTASQVALVPTWFLAAYVVVCSVAPATLWLWERLGWWSVVGGVLLGGLVDLVSLGTDTLWVGFANYLVVWATVHQLGYAWLDGRLAGTAPPAGLAAVGARGTGALVWAGPVPRVDDRPRRGGREQLLPDPLRPSRPSGCSRPGSSWPSSRCSPAGCARPRPWAVWCSQHPDHDALPVAPHGDGVGHRRLAAARRVRPGHRAADPGVVADRGRCGGWCSRT